MTLRRYVTEMGMGVDVHGQNYTTAANRAVSDAIRHSSLNFFNVLDKSPHDMKITLIIASPSPESVDSEVVSKQLPYGTVDVSLVKGGLEVPNDSGQDSIVITNAAVIVCFEE